MWNSLLEVDERDKPKLDEHEKNEEKQPVARHEETVASDAGEGHGERGDGQRVKFSALNVRGSGCMADVIVFAVVEQIKQTLILAHVFM